MCSVLHCAVTLYGVFALSGLCACRRIACSRRRRCVRVIRDSAVASKFADDVSSASAAPHWCRSGTVAHDVVPESSDDVNPHPSQWRRWLRSGA
jgi:hypothetical protein